MFDNTNISHNLNFASNQNSVLICILVSKNLVFLSIVFPLAQLHFPDMGKGRCTEMNEVGMIKTLTGP